VFPISAVLRNQVFAANAAFYRAFETQSLPKMRAVWLNAKQSTCKHPPQLHPSQNSAVGYEDSMQSWARLFRVQQQVSVKTSATKVRLGNAEHGTESLAWCTNIETRRVVGVQGDVKEAYVKTTNEFFRGADPAYTPPRYVWRLVQHNAVVIDPKEALSELARGYRGY
jgi:hypothetical protein